MSTFGKIFACILLLIYVASLFISYKIGSRFKQNRAKSMALGIIIASVIYFVVSIVYVLIDMYILRDFFESGYILSIDKNLYILSAMTLSILSIYYFSYTLTVKKLAHKPTIEIDNIGID